MEGIERGQEGYAIGLAVAVENEAPEAHGGPTAPVIDLRTPKAGGGKRGSWKRGIAVGTAAALIGGLGFATASSMSKLSSARAEISERATRIDTMTGELRRSTAVAAGLQVHVKDLSSTNAELTSKNTSLGAQNDELRTSVGSCQAAVRKDGKFIGAIDDMVDAAVHGDQAGMERAFGRAAAVRDQLDMANAGCLSQDGGVTAV